MCFFFKAYKLRRFYNSQVIFIFTFQNFYIVEFEDASCVENAVLSHSKHNSAGSSIPVYSPFLWFAGKNENVGSDMKQSESTVPVFLPPKTVDSDEGLIEHLSQFSTVNFSATAALKRNLSFFNGDFKACYQVTGSIPIRFNRVNKMGHIMLKMLHFVVR